MSDPIKVDSHVHVYRTQYDGLIDRVTCSGPFFEYGHQDDVSITWLAGTENELIDGMVNSGMDHAVILNLYIARRHRRNFIAQIPETVKASQRDQMIKAFDARQPHEFMEHNRWACRVARKHKSPRHSST